MTSKALKWKQLDSLIVFALLTTGPFCLDSNLTDMLISLKNLSKRGLGKSGLWTIIVKNWAFSLTVFNCAVLYPFNRKTKKKQSLRLTGSNKLDKWWAKSAKLNWSIKTLNEIAQNCAKSKEGANDDLNYALTICKQMKFAFLLCLVKWSCRLSDH